MLGRPSSWATRRLITRAGDAEPRSAHRAGADRHNRDTGDLVSMERVHVGLGQPAYDPYWGTQYPRRALLMALAGPLANLVLVVLAGVVLRVGFHAEWWSVEDPVVRLFGEGAALSGPAGERIALVDLR